MAGENSTTEPTLLTSVSPKFYFIFKNILKDIIVLENCKKINASDVERIFLKCNLVKEVCVKAKPNEKCFDDIHVFIYSQ